MLEWENFDVINSFSSNAFQIPTPLKDGTYLKNFELNSFERVAMCFYLAVTFLIPRFRYSMTFIARKRNAEKGRVMLSRTEL